MRRRDLREPMETGEQQDSKKARVDPDPLLDGCQQNKGIIDRAKLECPLCNHVLKPPIFQCAAGHLACGACHGKLAVKRRCYRCSHPGGYSRNFPLEDVVRSTRALCPYFWYGCSGTVPLSEMDAHQPKCPHAPCRCSEPNCFFVNTPSRVGDHLRDTHSWPVNSVDYGKPCHLRLPESKPRCLLVAKEDGRVFVVSVAALPVPVVALRGVSLVCLRRNAAAAGPHYRCKMWVVGSTVKVPSIFVDMELPSTEVAGVTALSTMDEAAVVVQRRMLHGPSKELHLRVKIDKVQA